MAFHALDDVMSDLLYDDGPSGASLVDLSKRIWCTNLPPSR